MSGDYRFEQDSFYAYKARVDHARVLGCNYHPNGLKKTYTAPEGVTYTYYDDGQDSPSAVSAGRAGTACKNNQFTAVHIPGSGQLSRGSFYWLQPQTLLLPGGSQVTLSYDDFLQVKERILQDPEQENVAEAIYYYDAVGDITAIDTEHGQYSFDYDRLYRLTDADYPLTVAANDETFDYDGVGNRTGHTQTPEEGEAEAINATYNNLNQLVSQTKDGVETTFTYNTNGHTKTKTEEGITTEYIYNHEERLIEVKINGQTVGEYAYNPLGQRIKKTVNGQTTWYLYNDEGLAAEYNASGQLLAEYHFTPYSTWMTEPLFQRRNGQVYYYQNDHLGTPQRMINSSGEVVWEAQYEAFGEAEIINEAVTNNLRFPGQYFDGESGLYHNFHRDYDPGIGRYVQSDPIGLDGGVNIYLYALQSPMIYIDELGLNPGHGYCMLTGGCDLPQFPDYPRPMPKNPGFGGDCGAEDQWLTPWIPDISPKACQEHDDCYDECAKECKGYLCKTKCDLGFSIRNPPYGFVTLVAGYGAYDSAREKHGCDDKC